MNFATVNDRAAARSRYITLRPFSDGAGFSQEERQMLRWQYPGLLVGVAVAEDIVLWTGRVLPGDTWVGEVVE